MTPTPTTERVPSGMRGPAIVAVGLAVVLGVLIARPWDARPAPSPVALIAPTPAALPVTSGPAPAATPATAEPTPQRALPTPDLAPPPPGGEAAIVAPADIAVVQCRYERGRGDQRRLAALEVEPPMALLDPASSPRHIRRIGWHFEVETIALQNLFDSEWERIDRSAWQVAPANATRPAGFTRLTSRFHDDAVEDTAAVRVRIVVEWYTRNDEVAGRTELFPTTYREGNAEFNGEWPPYCRVVI